MNSYGRNWNKPYKSLIITAGKFQKCNLDIRRTICSKKILNLEKMPCNESWIYCYDPETKGKYAGSPRPKKARQSKSTHKLLMIPFFDSTGIIYMHWVPTG